MAYTAVCSSGENHPFKARSDLRRTAYFWLKSLPNLGHHIIIIFQKTEKNILSTQTRKPHYFLTCKQELWKPLNKRTEIIIIVAQILSHGTCCHSSQSKILEGITMAERVFWSQTASTQPPQEIHRYSQTPKTYLQSSAENSTQLQPRLVRVFCLTPPGLSPLQLTCAFRMHWRTGNLSPIWQLPPPLPFLSLSLTSYWLSHVLHCSFFLFPFSLHSL